MTGNGKNGGAFGFVLRAIVGEVPAQWIRFVLLGVAATLLWKAAMDFKREMREDGRANRAALTEYIAANQLWQNTNLDVRAKLLRQVNTRFRRLYRENRWDYEEVEP